MLPLVPSSSSTGGWATSTSKWSTTSSLPCLNSGSLILQIDSRDWMMSISLLVSRKAPHDISSCQGAVRQARPSLPAALLPGRDAGDLSEPAQCRRRSIPRIRITRSSGGRILAIAQSSVFPQLVLVIPVHISLGLCPLRKSFAVQIRVVYNVSSHPSHIFFFFWNYDELRESIPSLLVIQVVQT